jgi:hypothetical protein
LAIQRQVVAVFRHQQVRQRGGRGAAARRWHRRGRGLGDGVARGAGIFRPDVADDLEVPRHVIQHLGDVLAEFGHRAAASGTGAGTVVGRFVHNILAWQMLRQLLALRLGALALWRRRWLAGFGTGGVFGRAGFQFLEPEFEPLDLLADPLR